MALRPWALDGGKYAEFHEGYWSIKPLFAVLTGHDDPDLAEDEWYFNPCTVVRDCDRETVRLWFMAGGREGLRHLPQAGGLLDQAQIMMDAFNVIALAVSAYPVRTETDE